MLRFRPLTGLVALLVLFVPLLAGCGGGGGGGGDAYDDDAPPPRGGALTIVSGSENKGLEPLIERFAQSRNARIEMVYRGSVDISLALQQGAAMPFDAVWPANNLWIDLGDTERVVRHTERIMRSPVVFAVRCSLVDRFGWRDAEVRIADILDAVEGGKLRFAMTSATQSNSGASFYLGALHALAGGTEALQAEALGRDDVRDNVKRLLRAVDRSSGSSGWLKDAYVARPQRFDAMVNYEAMLIEANQALVASGQEPLCAVYPSDGLTIADSPLGYVDRGDDAKEQLFLDLQAHLLSPEVQGQILDLGRRPGLLTVDASNAPASSWNPAWGVDPARTVSPVPLPRGPVIRQALELYQTVLRKPSWTVYVLDVSGSMEGDKLASLKTAMRTLLEPDEAARYLLQAAPEDRHEVIAFSSRIRDHWKAAGNEPDDLRNLLYDVQRLEAKGGTNMYRATAQGLMSLAERADTLENYFPAVIVMSDGASKGQLDMVRAVLGEANFTRDVPIFTIAFGRDADMRQLEELAELTAGRTFKARDDLVSVFRKAKGYN
ncbi:MAG: substrate-binding and VWA domain-containing protein [Acidobacteriota bacterium]